MTHEIIHLVVDDKFIDKAYRLFESVAPGTNRYIIVGQEKPLKQIRKTPIEFFRQSDFGNLLEHGNYSALIMHSLPNPNRVPFDRLVPREKKVMWIGWGYDYYKLLLAPAYPSGLVMNKTLYAVEPILQRQRLKKYANPILVLKLAYRKLLDIQGSRRESYLSRIDYFSPVLESEFGLARKMNPCFKPTYLPWNYGVLEEDIICDVRPMKSKSILIGNSATAENNHLEVFELLAKIHEVMDYNIIVPLSYGSNAYRDMIIGEGRKLFGDRFNPICTFMPLNDYVEFLSTCPLVFMNHMRQQGLGNIKIAMMTGAKVFINEASPVLEWFRQQGASVYSIDNTTDEAKSGRLTTPLTDADIHANRRILKDHWGRNAQEAKTKKVVDTLIGRAC